MPGPARAGLIVFAKDLDRLAGFYETVAAMTRLHANEELVVLESVAIQLLVHRIPPHIAENIVITSPPQRRENTALKFFLTVPSIADAISMSAKLGGTVFPEQREGPGFVVNDACDPEGNVFQLRQSTA